MFKNYRAIPEIFTKAQLKYFKIMKNYNRNDVRGKTLYRNRKASNSNLRAHFVNINKLIKATFIFWPIHCD